MNNLVRFCKDIKKDFTPKIRDSTRPVRCWTEKDVLDHKTIDAFVIIFRTKGCSWAMNSGCSMCGYFNDSMWREVSDTDLLSQFDRAMRLYSNEKYVKIFTSGSFLDENEISIEVRRKILERLTETCDKISVESRPEYIKEKKLQDIKNIIGSKSFEVGVGLETANDFIRSYAINKGFTFKDYKKAASVIKNYNCHLKTYVLVKPPFLTEKESINDCISTVEMIRKTTDKISFNPINVQRNTFVEYLWKRRQYRPAWLWSIIKILKDSKKIVGGMQVKCDLVGGGSIRGAHNCKECNNRFVSAISSFSIGQSTKSFNKLDCGCKQRWLDQLDIEDLGFGSLYDV
jgi:radical SAM enzyme (TIGR01210 family)